MSASSRLLLILMLFFALAALVTQAQARVFVIGDQDDKFEITFPDSWGMINNQKPDDKLTIAAPANGDGATCRVRVREDKRFDVYPARYGRSIQQNYYSDAFWQEYLNEYVNPSLSRVVSDQNLKIMPSSRADAYYTDVVGAPVQKRAVMMGGLYNGRAYVVDCSSAAGAFERYQGVFHTIMDTFTPTEIGNGRLNSYYRNFPADPILIINRQGGDKALYY